MNDTPTPLTDAAINDTALEDKNTPHTDWVTADFARDLERQLEEERKAKPLGQKVFDGRCAEYSIDDEIERITGQRDFTTSFDDYDQSIEVIMPEGVPFPTQTQAAEILALGFIRLFESNGTKGTLWTADQSSSCAVREYAGRRASVSRQLADLREEAERLIGAIQNLHDQKGRHNTGEAYSRLMEASQSFRAKYPKERNS